MLETYEKIYVSGGEEYQQTRDRVGARGDETSQHIKLCFHGFESFTSNNNQRIQSYVS